MAGIWDFLKGGIQAAHTGMQYADPQYGQAAARQSQMKAQDLNNILTRIKMAGGISTPAGQAIAKSELMNHPAIQGLIKQTGGKEMFTPSMGGVGQEDLAGYTPDLTIAPEGGVTRRYKPTTKSQLQAKEIQRLIAKRTAKTITKDEQAALDKMLIGQPLVEIGIGKPASAAERTAIAGGRASIDALNNLKTLFDSTQTKTGPLVGRTAPTMGLFGMTTDEQEAFMAATSAFQNAIIKQITGAQMSEVEAKRIMKQVPDITDPPARWKAKWEQSKKNLEFLQKRRMQVLQQSGLRVPLGDQEAAISPTPQPSPQIDISKMSVEELKRIAGVK